MPYLPRSQITQQITTTKTARRQLREHNLIRRETSLRLDLLRDALFGREAARGEWVVFEASECPRGEFVVRRYEGVAVEAGDDDVVEDYGDSCIVRGAGGFEGAEVGDLSAEVR